MKVYTTPCRCFNNRYVSEDKKIFIKGAYFIVICYLNKLLDIEEKIILFLCNCMYIVIKILPKILI